MTRLVDYFVLCGLKGRELSSDTNTGYVSSQPPLSRCYSCHVVCHFPDNLDYFPFDEAAIKTQCMPEGLQLTKNFRPRPKHHTMLITRENGSRVYGSVLIFYEPVDDQKPLDSLLKLQNEHESNCRFGISPDESLLFDQTCDTLYSSVALCLVSTTPVFSPLKAYLNQLYAVTMEEEQADLPVESYLSNLLYEVCLPNPGRVLTFTGPLGPLSWYYPGKQDLPLCDYSFRMLFGRLGVRNVIRFLTCVLLEQQILVKSSDLYLLMLCSECVTSLVFPFSWPHVFVPILPSSQKGFLDAPVPFIMGLRMDPESINEELDIVNKTSLCSVNIDLGIVEVPEDEIPTLPDHDKLIARVSEVLKQHDVSCSDLMNQDPSNDGGQDKKTVILDALRYFKSMSEGPPSIQQVPASKRVGIPLTHSSSLTKVTDHPIVREIKGIMVRTGSDGQDVGSPPTHCNENILEDHTHNSDHRWAYVEDESDVAFNSDIRTVFLNYFVEHFANYEHFSIMPNQTYQQWTRNREQFFNFDKTAFLSDQPNNHRPFYSAFLQTTMFSNLIDQKLIQWWDHEMTSPNLYLFDKCVDSYRQNSGIPTTPSTGNTPGTPTDYDDITGISLGAHVAPKPRLLTVSESRDSTPVQHHGRFPSLNSSLLKYEMDRNSVTMDTKSSKQSLPESISKRAIDGSRPAGNTGAFSHSKFVMQLWRECRSRVKHMLGSSAEAQSNIEANTQIANLCDLLERIWGHGLKRRDNKSPLWAHLIAYGEFLCREESPPVAERGRTSSSPNVHQLATSSTMTATPPRSGLTKSVNVARGGRSVSIDESSSSYSPQMKRVSRQKFRSPALKMRIEAILQPPASSFLEDLQIVNSMREIKTDVGRARAWVRLVLEKKSLSRHLTQMLSNINLCRKRYRHYAFLLTEDEKEQFLYHLLTLSAGDFTCFTTGFSKTMMTYRVLVVGEGKYFGLTTASLYVNVGGENGESGVIEIPKGEYQLEFSCANLGTLTCLRLGHDNSGLVRSLMVEMVLVLCVTTGQTYKFGCGRPLSKGEDDGSIERLLFGERVSRKLKGSANISALCISDVIPSTTGSTPIPSTIWTRSPKKENEQPMLSDVKSSFTNSICRMLRILDTSPHEATRDKLLVLMYGPDGFIKNLFAVLHFGFKSSRAAAFQKKQFYVWDMIERCLEDMPRPLLEADPSSDEEDNDTKPSAGVEGGTDHRRHLAELVSRINMFTRIGKHEKAVILFSIGLRDNCLCGWIRLLSSSTALMDSMYEPTSFFRDPELQEYLLQTIQQTQSINYVTCEPLLVQGL